MTCWQGEQSALLVLHPHSSKYLSVCICVVFYFGVLHYIHRTVFLLQKCILVSAVCVSFPLCVCTSSTSVLHVFLCMVMWLFLHMLYVCLVYVCVLPSVRRCSVPRAVESSRPADYCCLLQIYYSF